MKSDNLNNQTKGEIKPVNSSGLVDMSGSARPAAYEELQRVKAELLEREVEPVSPLPKSKSPQPTSKSNWWQKLSLRTKATVLGVALGILPVITIGAFAYYFSSQSLRKEVAVSQKKQAAEVLDKLNRFMFERYGDVQIISRLPVLSNPKIRAITTPEYKTTILEGFKEIYKVYDSIAVFDPAGNLMLQTAGTNFKGNYSDRAYFQEALKTGKVILNPPSKSKSTGKVSIELASPIKDAVSGQIIAVVRTRMPIANLENVIESFGSNQEGDTYHIYDKNGKIFMATEKEQVGRNALEDIPGLKELNAKGVPADFITFDISDGGNVEQVGGYDKTPQFQDMPNLNWGNAFLAETSKAYATETSLRDALLLGTGLAALVVGALAAFIANRATKPIMNAADAVAKIGKGELDTRLMVEGEDEISQLGGNINSMAEQLGGLIDGQKREAQLAPLIGSISIKARESLDLDDICNTIVQEAKNVLKCDRVVIYRFNPDFSGYISHESVLPGLPRAVDDLMGDPCIPMSIIEDYKQGRIVPTNDVSLSGYHPDHMALLHRLKVKANLVVPVVLRQDLFGILVAHHCANIHEWQNFEISFLFQLAVQTGNAIEQAGFVGRLEVARQEARAEADSRADEQKQEKEFLQRRALELLMEVDPVSRGDLTVRANVTADEVGTIADSYNAIIRSLRKLVAEVQGASASVSTTAGQNEQAIKNVATDSSQQAESINQALELIKNLALSSRGVETKARQAEEQVAIATQAVKEGDDAMNRTVEGISAIRETVSETAKKVKRLGEASQKISRVVNLIGGFATQTNMLALNAAIEAARAGEQGRGFSVVAEEVRDLAEQSASATAEIEQLVAEIQVQTNEVVSAMESGTEQVVAGTLLVEESRSKLEQISSASAKVNLLIQDISKASVAQAKTSNKVGLSMQGVAAIASSTSKQSEGVASSFSDLLKVAQELQTSVAQFKV
jgi:methyl-accepting chemotaxis protein PixJ